MIPAQTRGDEPASKLSPINKLLNPVPVSKSHLGERMRRLCRLSVFGIAAVAGLLIGTPTVATADTPASTLQTAPLTMESLQRTDQAGLEALYRSVGAGSVPVGSMAGRAIPSPGTRKGARKSKLIGLLWKGKELPGDGTMVNRLAFGVRAVRADVYYGESWLDGGPTIVLDYANTSRLFGDVRDEMREVAPGLYLGLTYVRKCPGPKLAMFYTVQTPSNCPTERAGTCR